MVTGNGMDLPGEWNITEGSLTDGKIDYPSIWLSFDLTHLLKHYIILDR